MTPADALATGDVVNTASRLQSAAPTGRLIVGAETYRATRHTIRYEQSEPVEAKGKAEPVTAWLAIEPSGAPAEGPAESVLVGRSHELELMQSLWERCVSERRPHLVTIVGPPGIGKSRLCRELSALVATGGGRMLRGRCHASTCRARALWEAVDKIAGEDLVAGSVKGIPNRWQLNAVAAR